MKRLVILTALMTTVNYCNPEEMAQASTPNLPPPQNEEKCNEEVVKKDYSECPDKTTKFIKRMRKSESSGTYNIISTTQCLGAFQFQVNTLLQLGYDTSKQFLDTFLVSPKLQEEAFIKLLKFNKRVLKHIIKKYEGLTVDSIEVTEAGILAGAHLGGPGGVIKWLTTKGEKNPKDAYGTTISDYVQKFSDIKKIKI